MESEDSIYESNLIAFGRTTREFRQSNSRYAAQQRRKYRAEVSGTYWVGHPCSRCLFNNADAHKCSSQPWEDGCSTSVSLLDGIFKLDIISSDRTRNSIRDKCQI